MKILIVVRHAEAGSGTPGSADFERPLTEQGTADARALGESLRGDDRIEAVISSPARRAVETARLVAVALGHPESSVREQPAIYEATPGQLLAVVQEAPAEARALLLVGHNPGVSALVQILGDERGPSLPPGAAAILQLDVATWMACAPGCGELLAVATPER